MCSNVPGEGYCKQSIIIVLEQCAESVSKWLVVHGMLLNPLKSESLLVGTAQQLNKVKPVNPILISGSPVQSVAHMKLIGFTFDESLSLNKYLGDVCCTCNFHIRALRHIRPCLTHDAAATLACCIVSTRLDYCNAALFGTSNHNLDRLQRVQNSLARVVSKAKQRASSSPLLQSLHWLPIRHRIKFKVAMLTFKAYREQTPAYLYEVIHAHVPSRALRSADDNRLDKPLSQTMAATKAFRSAAPEVWNGLPATLRSETALVRFKSALKTLLFREAFLSGS